jgi:hypothetical protein
MTSGAATRVELRSAFTNPAQGASRSIVSNFSDLFREQAWSRGLGEPKMTSDPLGETVLVPHETLPDVLIEKGVELSR